MWEKRKKQKLGSSSSLVRVFTFVLTRSLCLWQNTFLSCWNTQFWARAHMKWKLLWQVARQQPTVAPDCVQRSQRCGAKGRKEQKIKHLINIINYKLRRQLKSCRK